MGRKTIDPGKIDQRKLLSLLVQIENAQSLKRKQLPMTELMKILGFPQNIVARIGATRGNIVLAWRNMTCFATNSGKKVEEDIPGSRGLFGIIIEPIFRCQITLKTQPNNLCSVLLSNIQGLVLDFPFPLSNEKAKRIYLEHRKPILIDY